MNTEKYQNKYRIPPARATWWNYANAGCYFVTICTKNREHYFGEIIDGTMQLSEIGKIVGIEWLKTFEMRPDMNLFMDEYVIMPNHFHAIIFIGENPYNTQCYNVETQCIASLPTGNNQFGPQRKNLSSIIRGFKIGVTTNARMINPDFAWQERFYDEIIRSNEGLNNVRNYICQNPVKWNDDDYNNVKTQCIASLPTEK
jgi:REP element-mobilizing transposase RayT